MSTPPREALDVVRCLRALRQLQNRGLDPTAAEILQEAAAMERAERTHAARVKAGRASAHARALKRLRPAPNVVDLAAWRGARTR